jgi:hypothetical protein
MATRAQACAKMLDRSPKGRIKSIFVDNKKGDHDYVDILCSGLLESTRSASLQQITITDYVIPGDVDTLIKTSPELRHLEVGMDQRYGTWKPSAAHKLEHCTIRVRKNSYPYEYGHHWGNLWGQAAASPCPWMPLTCSVAAGSASSPSTTCPSATGAPPATTPT